MSRVNLETRTGGELVVGLDHAIGFFLDYWEPGEEDLPTISLATHDLLKRNSRGDIINAIKLLSIDRITPLVLARIAADLDPDPRR